MQKKPKKEIRKNVHADVYYGQPSSKLTDVHSPPHVNVHSSPSPTVQVHSLPSPPILKHYTTLYPPRQPEQLQPDVDLPVQRESQAHSSVDILIPPATKMTQVETSCPDEHLNTSSSSCVSTLIIDRSPQSEYGEPIEDVAQSDRRSWQPCQRCGSEFRKLEQEKKKMEDILCSISKSIMLTLAIKVST